MYFFSCLVVMKKLHYVHNSYIQFTTYNYIHLKTLLKTNEQDRGRGKPFQKENLSCITITFTKGNMYQNAIMNTIFRRLIYFNVNTFKLFKH